MAHELQNMVADKEELRWFFDHCLFPLQAWESYSMVLVSRHKKLTEEEKQKTGLTRSEAEFLRTETFRRPKFKSVQDAYGKNITFEGFYKAVCRLNFDKEAYLTPMGEPLPSKTLAVLFYVNPCDDVKVWDAVDEKVQSARTGMIKASLAGKESVDYVQSLQIFGNLDNLVKHAKALNKGTVYWADFDIDVPSWWKEEGSAYYAEMKAKLDEFVGLGNYVIAQTSGGYHCLVRTKAIRSNPKLFCEGVESIYREAVKSGRPAYLDDKGNCKFECVLSGPGIPGMPLPGTYQYDNPVRIINKGDFEEGEHHG